MKIEDRLAIHELLARYSFAFDSGDGDATADCYTEDGVFEVPWATCKGRSELVNYVAASRDREAHRHLVGPTVIDEEPGDPNSARVRAYFLYYEIEPAGPRFKLAGIYHDWVVKGDAGWKFKRRRVVVDMSRNVPTRQWPPSGPETGTGSS